MRQGVGRVERAGVGARCAPSRRAVLASLAASTVPLTLGSPALAVPASPWSIPYGAAVTPGYLDDEPAFRAAILRWCATVTPEGALKWAVIRRVRDRFDFEEGDRYVAFAARNGLIARGHCLVWAEAMPDWTRSIGQAEAEPLLVDHIQRVVGRYAGRIDSWDVVNEPMAPDGTTVGALRPSVWLNQLGPRYIDIAFRTAAAADPKATLVINEYDLGYDTPASHAKRDGFLALVRDLVGRGVPVHAVGLQGHLHGERRIDRAGLSAFVAAVAALGLAVYVTELDVIDDKLPGPPEERDRAAAAQATTFLGAVFDAARPRAVLTWGITDAHTWVPMYYRRADGLPNRPLPLDAAYREKPLMAVIERFCR